jgi:hypothetical protein
MCHSSLDIFGFWSHFYIFLWMFDLVREQRRTTSSQCVVEDINKLGTNCH